MEQHLEDLDTTLLKRNPLRITRLHLNDHSPEVVSTTRQIGKGTLTKIGVPLHAKDDWNKVVDSDTASEESNLRNFIRDHIIYNPIAWAIAGRKYTLNRPTPRRAGQPFVGEIVRDIYSQDNIDLIMLHFMGGADTQEIIDEAIARKTPFAVQNHFSNDRFNHLSIKKHALLANQVAGINELDIPKYLSKKFTNLKNGIDVNLFKHPASSDSSPKNKKCTILQPSRIIETKGQIDLIRAVSKAKYTGIEFQIKYAGRVDSPRYKQELDNEIERLNLQGNVEFLGILNKRELQEWYSKSDIVAFPTYHHEGLGRVIIEAQAMELPIIAYDSGGVREGLVDCETGFLHSKGDIDGFVESIISLAKNPSQRREMGKKGRSFVEKTWSLEALAMRHEKFYDRIMIPHI